MKNKFGSIKTKLILTVFASVGLASIGILLLCIVMIYASRFLAFAVFFYEHIWLFIIAFLTVFIVLSVVFFLLLIRRDVDYLQKIIESVQTISTHNLEVTIPVKREDELGYLATSINTMANQLKNSLDEEKKLQKEKSNLITNISHDLRTPLTSIVGYLKLMVDADDLDDKYVGYANIAYNQCMDLNHLIHNLFEYSKLQNNDFSLNMKRVNVAQLIEQTALGFIPNMEEVDMKYRLKIMDHNLCIEVDPVLMSRALGNVVSNAIRYGKEGVYLDILVEKEAPFIAIHIINYGSPIAKADINHIFERLHKGEHQESSGLGLTIVKRIIDLHEGTIRVKSDSKSTDFTIKIREA